MRAPDAVLFDLDGTLLDTAADMAAALNATCERHGKAPVPTQQVRPHVSRGAMALLALRFNIDLNEDTPGEEATALRAELLENYRRDIPGETRLFAGMGALLVRLESAGMPWGIVTNKPEFLTAPLLQKMGLATRAACAISGDTLPQRKPEPQPLWHACKLLNARPAHSVYIGDDARDVEAGRAAGMQTIAAAYGYIAPGAPPHEWGADAVVAHADEIWGWLTAA